jgi:hypothetical protein
MQEAMEFRSDVEEQIDATVSPVDPAAFLKSILAETEIRAEGVARVAERIDDESLAGDLSEFADEVASNANEVREQFESAEFGTFQVVSAALNFNYSSKIYEARQLRADHEDTLSDDGEHSLQALQDMLELFGPAREHFKTLYFQWELINLSRAVLYSAVPALTSAIAMILFFRFPGAVPGETLAVGNGLWIIGLATLASIGPFMLVVSFILRIATVAKRTLAIGPFVLRGGDDARFQFR